MWEKLAKEMQLPWRAAEAMHWQIGEMEMATRANVPVFHLAGQSSGSVSAATDSRPSSTSPNSSSRGPHLLPHPHLHSHTLPHGSQPTLLQTAASRDSISSSSAEYDYRHRADSARSVPHPSNRHPSLPPILGNLNGSMPVPQHNLLPPLTSPGNINRH